MKDTKQNCIVDARVSSDRQLDGRGLDDQEERCERYAQSRDWNIVNVFSKSYSGREEERKDFEEILSYIKICNKKGIKIDYYVVKSIDRLTRSGAYGFTEMKKRIDNLGVELVDTFGVIQSQRNTLEGYGIEYPWSRYSPTDTAQLMEAERAKSDVRDILTRMIGAEVSLVRNGYSIRSPLDGYVNQKIIIEGRTYSGHAIDKERDFYFKEIFKLRASGRYTDKEIVDKINAQGYKSKEKKKWSTAGKRKRIVGKISGKPMTVKQLQKLIKRTMYAGVKNESWNDNPVWAVFADGSEAIASVDLFNQANKGAVFIRINEVGNPVVLYNYTEKDPNIKTRRKYNPDYKYDKMIHCDICHKPLINSGIGNPGKSGKRYKAYHCDRKIDGVKHYKRIRKEELEKQMTHFLKSLKFKDNFMEKFEEKLIKKYREREKEVLSESIKIGSNVTELKIEQEQLLESLFLTKSDLVRQRTEERIEKIQKQIDKATEERDKIEIKERDIKSFVAFAKDLMEHPAKMLADNRNPVKQHALFGLFFEEPLSYSDIVNGTPKLTLLFKVSEKYKTEKSSLVNQTGISWNQVIKEYMEFVAIAKDFETYKNSPQSYFYPLMGTNNTALCQEV